MTTPRAGRTGRLGIVLEMIKFEHTLFALPFALTGTLLAARGWPAGRTLFWIVVAMVGARSAAMGWNRFADRHLDAANPRTRSRALPAGRLTPGFVAAFVSAVVVVSRLLDFVSRSGYAVFAWWRIAVGLATLVALALTTGAA